MEEELESAANEYACGEYDPAAPWRWKGDLHVQSKESFIAGATWQKEQSGWIKCSERLPKLYQKCAFVISGSINPHRDGQVYGGAFLGLKGVAYNQYACFATPGVEFGASHWQPLPDKPQQV